MYIATLARNTGFIAGAALLLAGLGGCASLSESGAAAGTQTRETIGYSVGPCFGFCPVYEVVVNPTGHVTYTGARHTAVTGPKEGEAGAGGYNAAAMALAAFRPADGTTAQTQCEQRRTDQQHYIITWTKPDGTKTVLEHDRGCISPSNDKLNKALDSLPAKLGIADWARQTTEPGASRG